jgi:hypothetical protein
MGSSSDAQGRPHPVDLAASSLSGWPAATHVRRTFAHSGDFVERFRWQQWHDRQGAGHLRPDLSWPALPLNRRKHGFLQASARSVGRRFRGTCPARRRGAVGRVRGGRALDWRARPSWEAWCPRSGSVRRLRRPVARPAFSSRQATRSPAPRGPDRRPSYREPAAEQAALPVRGTAPRRAAGHFGRLAHRGQEAGDVCRVFHHGEEPHSPLALGAG